MRSLLRAILTGPELPIILLAGAGVYTTVCPPPLNMRGYYLAGLVVIGLWGMIVSVAARMRSESGTNAQFQELSRLLRKNIERAGQLARKKEGDVFVEPPAAEVALRRGDEQ